MTLRMLLLNHILPALVADPRLLPVDVVVYLGLLFSPAKHAAPVATRTDIPVSTVRRSIQRLIKHEWVYVADAPRGRNGRAIIPWMPGDLERTIADRLQLIQFDAAFRGEWLLKCIVDHLVAETNVHDNTRPAWATPGRGSNRLELDRWYPDHRVAIEFQGAQHFQKGETINTTEEELGEQIFRDNLKAAICLRHRVQLIEFTTADLSYAKVRHKLEGHLPLIPIREEGPIFTAITNMCLRYLEHMTSPAPPTNPVMLSRSVSASGPI